MAEEQKRDDELFEALGKNRKKRRRRTARTVLITILVILAALVIAIVVLQRRVQAQFAAAQNEVISYAATVGSVSTTVSGSGQLSDVDTEEITVPYGVEVTGVSVEEDEAIAEGAVLARLDIPSVLSAMSALQEELDDLDAQLAEARSDEVDDTITAGVSGRVKLLYAGEGDRVADCMTEHGALAVLSVDGKMAVDIETDALAVGDAVTVDPDDGWLYDGTVDSVAGGVATILLTDNGPIPDATAVVRSSDGETEFGTGALYIHSPLKVTGFAGTVESVKVEPDEKVTAGDALFTLTDTSYSANYDAILRQREEKEAVMLELLGLYEDGALLAPFAGSVLSVDYEEEPYTAQTSLYGAAKSTEPIRVVTLSPDEKMEVTIAVDESDILSLEIGQAAEITVSSLGDESFSGTVTEIDRSSAAAGQYAAVITLEKDARMLSGMTAGVDVAIEGTENAVLIPAAALHRTSAEAYVYTYYDENTGEYGGKRKVVTGVEGSEYVEITEGLAEGETVYYTEAQSVYSFTGFGGGRFGGGSPFASASGEP